MLRWLLRPLRHLFEDKAIAVANARFAAMELASERAALTCDICLGIRYECPECHAEIMVHSHEGDYACDTHSFVDPVRCFDGARIDGSGRVHQRVLETTHAAS